MTPSLIASVEVIPVALPLRAPYRIATAVQTRAEYVVVRLRTADGMEGTGEAAPLAGESDETAPDIAAVLCAALVPAVVAAIAIKDGAAGAPAGPGLGVSVASATLERFRST